MKNETTPTRPTQFVAHAIVWRGDHGFITCGDNVGTYGYVPNVGNTVWGSWEFVVNQVTK